MAWRAFLLVLKLIKLVGEQNSAELVVTQHRIVNKPAPSVPLGENGHDSARLADSAFLACLEF